MTLCALLNRLFHGPAWLTFLVMGMAAGGLALCSFNLLFQANYHLLFTYGAMAAFDGGLLQFIELTAWGYLGLACYIVVEGCLEGLLARIRRARLWRRSGRAQAGASAMVGPLENAGAHGLIRSKSRT
jgi:hypothetical protein